MEMLLSLARQAGFSQLTELDAAVLKPMTEVRDMCSADRCRSYGKSWSCPPACGSIEYAARRISQYRRGLIVQTTGKLEDEFDLQAIAAIEARHKKALLNLARQARLLFPGCLPLSSGTCSLCRKCTYPDRPCRFPGKRLSSMEAYGLLVSDVSRRSGLGYYYGTGTMTYTSCVLYKTKNEVT